MTAWTGAELKAIIRRALEAVLRDGDVLPARQVLEAIEDDDRLVSADNPTAADALAEAIGNILRPFVAAKWTPELDHRVPKGRLEALDQAWSQYRASGFQALDQEPLELWDTGSGNLMGRYYSLSDLVQAAFRFGQTNPKLDPAILAARGEREADRAEEKNDISGPFDSSEAPSYLEVRTTACQAGSDGDCNWADCPQIADGEPTLTGRDCPLLLVARKEGSG